MGRRYFSGERGTRYSMTNTFGGLFADDARDETLSKAASKAAPVELNRCGIELGVFLGGSTRLSRVLDLGLARLSPSLPPLGSRSRPIFDDDLRDEKSLNDSLI